MKPTERLTASELMEAATCGPETRKFLKWYETERAKGLCSIRFLTSKTEGATVESFCAEVNRALEAPDLPDNELDGYAIPVRAIESHTVEVPQHVKDGIRRGLKYGKAAAYSNTPTFKHRAEEFLRSIFPRPYLASAIMLIGWVVATIIEYLF